VVQRCKVVKLSSSEVEGEYARKFSWFFKFNNAFLESNVEQFGRMIFSGLVICLMTVFSLAVDTPASSGIQKHAFGKSEDGQAVDLYLLRNKSGMEVSITNYGGAVVSLKVPDKAGKFADVVLGYDDLQGYIADKSFFGAIIGRYANRIAHGKFTLNGSSHSLAKNNGENSLHGGNKGFNKRVWTAQVLTVNDVSGSGAQALELTYRSQDGEEGYPGNLTAKVVYTLTEKNELKIEYSATTDKDTVVNLTNHSYFNLAGQGNGDILNHRLTIQATEFSPVDATLIPEAQARSVLGTPFDFSKPVTIGARINQDDQQLKFGLGYDHNWILFPNGPPSLSLAAEVYEPNSGRVMEVLTTEPGLQFYSGNFLDGSVHGKGGKVYGHRSGFCLETQHFPDSPNHPAFPSTVLKPGQRFHSTTVYKFSAR
jgi:aldose 1-epimerase